MISGSIVKNFWQFSAVSIQGKEIGMDTYKGKVVLVVNTASKCGFTPQYEGLEKLYEKYRDNGFVVLGFPCNQFLNQEPGTDKEIEEGCLIIYGITFPMFSKIDVNGENVHPIFKYLKEKLPGVFGKRIGWNFVKFLINRQGQPVKRFSSATKPEQLERDIEKLLNARV